MCEEFQRLIVEPLAAEMRVLNALPVASGVSAPVVRECPRVFLPQSIADYTWPDPMPAWCERWPN